MSILNEDNNKIHCHPRGTQALVFELSPVSVIVIETAA